MTIGLIHLSPQISQPGLSGVLSRIPLLLAKPCAGLDIQKAQSARRSLIPNRNDYRLGGSEQMIVRQSPSINHDWSGTF